MYFMSGKMWMDFDLVFLYLGIYPKEAVRVTHTQKLCARLYV